MNRLTRIILAGFKGLDRTYELEPATLLAGPNGAGKSAALEAVVYALSGKVPAGRALDLVALYFGPRGGTVELHDAAGRWIRRGITRDHERKKVSEVLETSDTAEGADEPDLSAWGASEVVLDLREFLGLSAEKRREHVLRICGSGAGAETILEEVQLEYVRQVAGPAAQEDTLFSTDLPEDLRALCLAWRRPRGLFDVLGSSVSSGRSVTENSLRLLEVAKDGKSGARKAALDARAALRELEAEVRGAEAAAAEIDTRRREVEDLRERVAQAREARARTITATADLRAATEARQAAEANLDLSRKALEGAPPAQEAPPDPEPGPELEAAMKEHREAAADSLFHFNVAAKIKKELDAHLARVRRFDEASRALLRHGDAGVGQVVKLVLQIPDEAHEGIPALRAAINAMAAEWAAEGTRLLEAVDASAPKGPPGDWQGIVERAEKACTEAEARVGRSQVELDRILAEGARNVDAHRGAVRYAEEVNRRRRTLENNIHSREEVLAAARAAEASADTRFMRTRSTHGDPAGLLLQIEDLEEAAHGAQAGLRKAEEAAGAVKAYRDAQERAERNRVDEEAWKRAGLAIRAAQERLVAVATAPLVTVANEVFERAGRRERVYLELENDRGRPAFELGWIGAAGKTSLQALSSGEATLLSAALSVAIALRSEGRRVLLIEADPLDAENLPGLFRALSPWAADLDALLVATASDVYKAADNLDGWQVIEVAPARKQEASR